MSAVKFEEIIDVVRYANCKTCSVFIYTMPCHLDVDFEDCLRFAFGKLKYPLSKMKVIRMDNELVKLTSRVGRNWLEIKFKKQEDQIKPLFEIQLAGYVGSKSGINITM